MRQIIVGLVGACVFAGILPESTYAEGVVDESRILGNIANQVIAGERSSTATWTVDRGRVTIFALGDGRIVLALRAKRLIIPALGFNPSPDFLARVVCHDEGGAAFVAAQTDPAPLSREGNGRLVDEVELPEACFAPIVLIGGSTDPAGNVPGNWFAVSGFQGESE
jgi:hypothetical protein